MAIAGMIAAIAGAIQVMGVTNVITVLPAQEGYGFDGIAVALIQTITQLVLYSQDYYSVHSNMVEQKCNQLVLHQKL